MAQKSTRPRLLAAAALGGVVSAAVVLAVAELLALAFARQASPVLAVGSFVIDIVPRWAKELAISLFGGADKIVLLASVGLGVLVVAAVAGVLQVRRPPIGAVLVGATGVVATLATITRAGASPVLAAIPTLAGTVAGVLLLIVLSRRVAAWRSAPNADDAGVRRRDFLRISLIAGTGAVIAGVGARVVNAAVSSGAAVREALKLPAPANRVRVPEGADLDLPGLSPIITPNEDFYRVDTALTVPSIDPSTWRLKVNGMVGREVELSFDDLVAMGVDEYGVTLTCVSNEVGGGLVGNAVWLGVPVRDILRMAAPDGDADMVLSRSVDGYTASTPLEALTSDDLDAILAIGMNGEPLPLEHGFPVRMVVPGLYGYVSATKWLTELTVTRFDRDEAYWTPRGYDAEAPIKLSSRIDTPRVDKAVAAGSTVIAGMAWAQPVGVGKVEVQIDDGEWQEATLSAPINDYSWVQWYLDWEATSGTHYVAVRATGRDGTPQEVERAPIAPNGSSGLQRTLIRVS